MVAAPDRHALMRFMLNGVPVQAECVPAAPLLYTLREKGDARGVRFGCGAGQCGACTVLIDGVAEPSCLVANHTAEQRHIETVEGLAADAIGAVVLQAFVDEQAAQCGYCINGILMSLTGLLRRNAKPSAAALEECLSRHLCRCGTHLRIVRAAHRAIARLAEQATPEERA